MTVKVIYKKLGPGLLFAGAAIGVSHLVQSTRAGADFGWGLLWALLLINLIKYPFFRFGSSYASQTGESLLDGYFKLGKRTLWLYIIVTALTMFTIQTAVTIVTAGLAVQLFGITDDVAIWSVIITFICALLLLLGRFKALDHLMKIIVLTLTISTFLAVGFAVQQSSTTISFTQILPTDPLALTFLIAFMGWMPAPLDISIWQSLWTQEKAKTATISKRFALFDFNVGYIGAIVLGIGFLALGALVMHKQAMTFSNKGGVFAGQLIDIYAQTLGEWATIFVSIAAFTTMFSTTLTTLDASPRAMARASDLLSLPKVLIEYRSWLIILVLGTSFILFFLISEMGLLVEIATVFSFVMAPFYAICNYLCMSRLNTKMAIGMQVYSWIGMVCLVGFSAWYLVMVLL